jgi:hypothetical protein
MANISRYTSAPILGYGRSLGTTRIISAIRSAIDNGQLSYSTLIIHDSERLDTIAWNAYKDGRYWWVLAAASNIGWGLQVPPGTVIKVPDLNEVLSFVV